MHRGGCMHRGVCSAPRAYMSMSMHTYVSMSIVHAYVYMCSCSVVPRAAQGGDTQGGDTQGGALSFHGPLCRLTSFVTP